MKDIALREPPHIYLHRSVSMRSIMNKKRHPHGVGGGTLGFRGELITKVEEWLIKPQAP